MKGEIIATAANLLQQEGYSLMGAAFEVYNEQGYGLAEEIYQESLEIELELRRIPYKAKQELTTFYKGRLLKKRYIPDLVAYDQIVIELKAVSEILPEHEAQLLNYHARQSYVGRLPDQLRPQRYVGMEAIHSDRSKTISVD